MLLKSDKMRKTMEILAGGSSQKNLSPIETGKLIIPYNETVVASFSIFANNLINTIVSNLAENEKLSNLRNWLLPMLMNGQATVAD